jgi:WD40 repeat protein
MGNLLRCVSTATDKADIPQVKPKQEPIDNSPSYPPLHGESIVNSVIVTNGVWISASGGEDGHVVLFDWSDGKVLHRWTEHKRAVNRLAYGSKTETIFSGSRDGTVLMWQAGNDTAKQHFQGHELTVNGVAVCAPDDRMLFSGSRDWTVR